MIYSKTCEYAIRALLCLAEKKKGAFVLTRTVSKETGVPAPYLAKIFQELVRFKILDSRRGAAGGVALRRDPKTLSLRRIMEIIDDPEHLKVCVMGLDQCSGANPCPLHTVWTEARKKIVHEMDSVNLASFTKKLGKASYRGVQRAWLNTDLNLSNAAEQHDKEV